VWSVPDGSQISDTAVDGTGLNAEDISGDGRILALGGQDSSSIKLFDLSTMTQIGASFGGPQGSLWTIDIDRSQRMLAAGGDQVFLWDLASGTVLGSPFPGVAPDTAYFSPDGRHLYVLGGSGEAWIMDVDPLSWDARACRIAGRTLTEQEWSTVLPDRPYEPACTGQ
jgi:WD40 repeat protein